MTLKEDLQEIQGVGEATASSIIDVLEENDALGESVNVEKALYFLRKGNVEAAKSVLEAGS
jgi:DNA uptake protein ComE-like DNA-binding protein